MAAKRNSLWFGYLEANEKGSPVVRDTSMDTGSSLTIYLFNLKKGQILEYRRDIVEPKLRELTDEETGTVAELRKAFQKARNGFTPRAMRRPPSPPRRPRPEPEPELPEVDFDSDDDSLPLLDDGGDDAMSADQMG
jgi:hypothetical protein